MERLSADMRQKEAEVRRERARIRKANRSARAPKVRPTAQGQREPRRHDADYMAWLHHDMTCIACMLEGRPALQPNPIEAAHQKMAIASAGWSMAGKGNRGHDERCVPLCAWHHRLAPNACDTKQRSFWDRLGLGDAVADFARDLHAAFKAGRPGQPVITAYANMGAERKRNG